MKYRAGMETKKLSFKKYVLPWRFNLKIAAFQFWASIRRIISEAKIIKNYLFLIPMIILFLLSMTTPAFKKKLIKNGKVSESYRT